MAKNMVKSAKVLENVLKPQTTVIKPLFELYSIVFCKMRGTAADWPCIVDEINLPYIRVHFFGDYRTAKLHSNAIKNNFKNGFVEYLKSKHTKNKQLEKAVKEAGIFAEFRRKNLKMKRNCMFCHLNE